MKEILRKITKVTFLTTLILGAYILTNSSVVQAKIEMEDNTKKVKNYGDNYEYVGYINDDNTFTLCGVNGIKLYASDGKLELPSYVSGHKVTRIEGVGEKYWNSFEIFSPELVTEISFPDTVEAISKAAFNKKFINLKSLKLPNNKLFYDEELHEKKYEDYYDSDYLWFDKSSLTEVSCARPMRWMESDGHYKIKVINIIGDLDEININARYKYSYLEKLTMNDNIEKCTVFYGENLKNVQYSNNIKELEIEGNSLVTSLKLPEKLERLYLGWFENIKSIQLPNSIKYLSIGGLEQMEDINLPNSLVELAMYNFPKMISVNLPKTVKVFSISDMENLSSINCPQGLKNISIPVAVGCPNLKIEIWINTMGDASLYRDFAIEGSDVDSSPEHDYYWYYHEMRYYNSGIEKINISEKLFYDEAYYRYKTIFSGANNLKAVNVINPTKGYYYSIDGVLYWSDDKKQRNNDDLLLYPATKNVGGNFTIPSWVKCIYAYAFDGCKLSTVTIPENVPEKFYYDYYTNWVYQEKSFLNYNKIKLKVVPYSLACTETAKDLAEELGVSNDRVLAYKGNKYKITYDLAGGKNNPKNPNLYTAGDKPIYLKDPTRRGYIFAGWKRSDGEKWGMHTGIYKRFQDLKFTAYWVKKFSTSKITKIKSISGRKIEIYYKKVKKVSGYQIEYSTDKKFKKNWDVINTKKLKTTIKKLKVKKKYYIRIRTYKKVNGFTVFSKYTKIKSVIVKK